jgi:hypothetical protein
VHECNRSDHHGGQAEQKPGNVLGYLNGTKERELVYFDAVINLCLLEEKEVFVKEPNRW